MFLVWALGDGPSNLTSVQKRVRWCRPYGGYAIEPPAAKRIRDADRRTNQSPQRPIHPTLIHENPRHAACIRVQTLANSPFRKSSPIASTHAEGRTDRHAPAFRPWSKSIALVALPVALVALPVAGCCELEPDLGPAHCHRSCWRARPLDIETQNTRMTQTDCHPDRLRLVHPVSEQMPVTQRPIRSYRNEPPA